ncbi:MAG TPA: metal/formaldehyde-sensitive transcriptional repressor [Terracidiphilus sp.]|nr:metal/formaldehyde-sensitive transcriptional repressor [Terracidiphilus sp.]
MVKEKMQRKGKNDMTIDTKEQQKLVARIRRIKGQVDAIERSLIARADCADILMLLANVRGGINGLMAEVLEDHIRLHIATPEKDGQQMAELAEDLIDLVRAYLK